MYQSKLFLKTTKESPAQEKAISAKFLIRGGFIEKLSSGIYNFLPLGFIVLKKIEGIIREEMKKISAQEVLLAALHPKEYWVKTKRWEKMTDLYKLKEKNKEFALGPTHEEIIVPLAKKFIKSFRDLPVYLFQIQVKFRKELRPKGGLLRTREFIMKDLYSFHTTKEDLDLYYEKVKKSYFRIFERCGIKKKTFLTLASGGTFSEFSHEFQTICPSGEDTIFVCRKCNFGINQEIKSFMKVCPQCKGNNFKKEKTIEVGNIFKLLTKFSRDFDFRFLNKSGKKEYVLMGCYGIGLGRLMAAIVEVNHDEKGIIWPKEIAPFLIHLLPIGKVREISKELYKKLKKDFEVLYDDRDNVSVGEKFYDSDLIGIPIRLVVSEKTLTKNSVELKLRKEKKQKLVKIKNLKKEIKECLKKL
jgi:prolyl-tRNA synthetase